MSGLPDLPGCGQPATVRIEAYSARDGRMHGSLDGTVYTCDAHAGPAADAITAAGFTPYRMAVADLHQIEVGAEPTRCGRGFDYTGDETRIYEAPEPLATAPSVEPDADAPAVDPITAAGLAALAENDYNEHYLIGYLGAGLRWAVAAHPDDDSLRRDLALYEAWSAHQNEQGATARRTAAEAQVTL